MGKLGEIIKQSPFFVFAMQTNSSSHLNATQLLLAVIAIMGVHAIIGWQYALVIPLVYAYLLPSRAYLACTVQMLLAWGVLGVASYALAPAETARMLEAVVSIIGRNAAHGLGWVMPIASLLFAALLGLLCGIIGSSTRFVLARAH
jgi:hypothetical protein